MKDQWNNNHKATKALITKYSTRHIIHRSRGKFSRLHKFQPYFKQMLRDIFGGADKYRQLTTQFHGERVKTGRRTGQKREAGNGTQKNHSMEYQMKLNVFII